MTTKKILNEEYACIDEWHGGISTSFEKLRDARKWIKKHGYYDPNISGSAPHYIIKRKIYVTEERIK